MLQIYAPIPDLSTLSSFSFQITARESPSISTLKSPSCKPISVAWEQAIASTVKGECMLIWMIVFDQRTVPESSLIIIVEQHTRVKCCPSCNSLLRVVHIAHIAQQNARKRHNELF
ncbi:hypothetical protein E1A91_A11G241500v1 [Gossypium mustelinum]|uniref:Uncharacterized protein n=1 Tax=Gossypium mustelinum TaxID=34275 RepID=A0A5D2XAV7_GOSMU|nr:hypothetical protein E1A91_A11G241500v1 [Gossypium mustelinum]